jgi:hypothetical protein
MNTTGGNLASIIAALSAIFITTSHLYARIGETPQECAARYGQPIKTLQEDMLLYEKAGLGVIVTFYKGKADAIAYRKIAENALGKGEKISDNEIEFLLKSNSGDTPWKKRSVISRNREWESENSNLLATYITFENLLVVATQDYLAREKAKKNAKEGKTLDGF